jgi:cytochrome bd ubiquinol oxidase subunit I
VGVATGSWLSGFFILVTNAFMQHPTGYTVAPNGTLALFDLGAYLLNPWAFVQFAHNQCAALVTGSCVIAAMGAFYTLRGIHPEQSRLYLNAGTFVGLLASVLLAFRPATLKRKWSETISRRRWQQWRAVSREAVWPS